MLCVPCQGFKMPLCVHHHYSSQLRNNYALQLTKLFLLGVAERLQGMV